MKAVRLVRGQINFLQLIDKIIDCTNESECVQAQVEFLDGNKPIQIIGRRVISSEEFTLTDDDHIVDGLKIKEFLENYSPLILKSATGNKFWNWGWRSKIS